MNKKRCLINTGGIHDRGWYFIHIYITVSCTLVLQFCPWDMVCNQIYGGTVFCDVFPDKFWIISYSQPYEQNIEVLIWFTVIVNPLFWVFFSVSSPFRFFSFKNIHRIFVFRNYRVQVQLRFFIQKCSQKFW